MIIKTKLIFISLSLFYYSVTLAQTVTDYSNYADKYKDKDIVYLNVKDEVTVNIVKSGLQTQESVFEEIYYNNFKAGIFSEKKIESSHYAKLKDIAASTLLLDNNKVKEVKVKDFKTTEAFDEDIFYQDLYSTSFIFPSLRKGAISRLKYTIDITDPHFFPYEVFQKYSPVENFEYTINSDKNVDFEFKYLFMDTLKYTFTKEEKGSRIIYTWKVKNIPGFKLENKAPSYVSYLPQLISYVKSYKVKDKDSVVFKSLDDLFKWYNQFLSKIDYKHTDEMISTVDSLVKNCKTDHEKVAAIYKWVQTNIKYIANEYKLGGYVPRNPYQIFEKRYGDCKDMATIIIELLDIAKVKAYYTWIGTNDLPYSYYVIPTSMVTNHMIATYIENGIYYFLDATNPYNPLGLPSSFIQNKEAMIRLSNEKYEIKKVPIGNATENAHSDSLNISYSQGKVIGSGVLKLTGYYSSDMAQVLAETFESEARTKFMKSYLERGNNKFVLDNYKLNSTENNISVSSNFNIADYVNVNGNELYINLNLSQPYADMDLFLKDRKVGYKLYFCSFLQSDVVFTVPEGYDVNYLPANTTFKNDLFGYTIHYEKKENKIIYHFQIGVNTLLLQPELFDEWNKMLKQIKSDYKEVVVLKKI